MKLTCFLFALILMVSSCSDKETPEFNKFVYRYHDSSVPPEYHRSYTITMSPTEISKWVDSYGDTVSFDVQKTNGNDFNKLKQLVASANLRSCKDQENNSCTGGTGLSIYYYINDKLIFKGSQWECGGVFEGDMCGETAEILKHLNTRFSK